MVGGLVPLAGLALDAASGALGANPIQRALLQTGVLTLTLLAASLACTPLKLLTSWTWPPRVRKALGLLAFVYALVHFLIYNVDHGFSLRVMLADIVKRPFITVGFAALVLLVPLALTSTKGAVRRLGFPAWQRLHRLAYLAAALGVVHYWWGVKKDHTVPLEYGLVIAGLFAVRLAWSSRKRQAKKARVSPVARSAEAE